MRRLLVLREIFGEDVNGVRDIIREDVHGVREIFREDDQGVRERTPSKGSRFARMINLFAREHGGGGSRKSKNEKETLKKCHIFRMGLENNKS